MINDLVKDLYVYKIKVCYIEIIVNLYSSVSKIYNKGEMV